MELMDRINSHISDNKYIDPSVMIEILEDLYMKSFNELKKYIKDLNISINEETINDYLRVHNVSPTDTYDYLKKLTSLYKDKSIELLDLIETIVNNSSSYDEDSKVIDLDIILNEDKEIKKSDVIRILKPTIYNIEELKNNIKKGNDKYTYLATRISYHQLYIDGISEEELYPDRRLQIKSLESDSYGDGYIPLTEYQKQVLWDEYENIVSNLIDIIDPPKEKVLK